MVSFSNKQSNLTHSPDQIIQRNVLIVTFYTTQVKSRAKRWNAKAENKDNCCQNCNQTLPLGTGGDLVNRVWVNDVNVADDGSQTPRAAMEQQTKTATSVCQCDKSVKWHGRKYGNVDSGKKEGDDKVQK